VRYEIVDALPYVADRPVRWATQVVAGRPSQFRLPLESGLVVLTRWYRDDVAEVLCSWFGRSEYLTWPADVGRDRPALLGYEGRHVNLPAIGWWPMLDWLSQVPTGSPL
jgi:hypothetical protein